MAFKRSRVRLPSAPLCHSLTVRKVSTRSTQLTLTLVALDGASNTPGGCGRSRLRPRRSSKRRGPREPAERRGRGGPACRAARSARSSSRRSSRAASCARSSVAGTRSRSQLHRDRVRGAHAAARALPAHDGAHAAPGAARPGALVRKPTWGNGPSQREHSGELASQPRLPSVRARA